MSTTTTISLALSGGGMRGCAHIGVLQRLEELKIEAKFISGSSMGAIIGVLYADGFASQEIAELLIKSKFGFDFNYFGFTEALLSSKRIEDILKKNLRSKNFDQLKTPLFVCATELNTGQPEYFSTGEVLPAVMASSAIPLLYKPVKLGEKFYVDGGVSRNLPTAPLRQKNLPILGVYVNPLLQAEKKTMAQKIDHSMHLLLLEKLLDSAKDCAVFIEPQKLSTHSLFDTKNIQEIINIGYEEAKNILKPKLVLGLGGSHLKP
jgi:NTE family protein